jgi:arylsulfatase
MMSERPNIVLVMADQHRADMLGCAGDPVIKTPHIDQLAREGVRFERAYCQGPLCMPARASVLTERFVRDHGVFENSSQVADGTPTFLHRLRDAGYHTAEIGKMHLWPHGQRHERSTIAMRELMTAYGFDEPIETVGKLASRTYETPYTEYLRERGLLETYREFIARTRLSGNRAGTPAWQADPCPLPIEDYPDAWHGRRAADWIDSYAGRAPFFLWVGFPGPHNPWDAPREAVDQYRDAEIPMPRSLERPAVPAAGPFKLFLNAFLAHSDSATMTDAAIVALRRAYYANVSVIDAGLGAITAALARRKMLDNTWVIYTSDHGEMMGEHRMLMKMVFYEPSVRVPMIVRPPGAAPARVVRERVQLMDLSATVRDIAGAGAIEGSGANSLLPVIRDGASPTAIPALVSENYGFAMFLADRYKLVVFEDTLEVGQLFDEMDDPAENRNLCGDPAYAKIVNTMLEEHVRPFFKTAPLRPHPALVARLAARQTRG